MRTAHRSSAIDLCALDVDLIRDFPVDCDRRLPDLEDVRRVPLEKAQAASRDNSQGTQFFKPLPGLRSDKDDSHPVPQHRVGKARYQGVYLRPDAVAAIPPWYLPSVRANGGMPEEGADAFGHRRGQDVLELACAALRLDRIEIEQVLKQHLREAMSPDD